MNKCFASDNCGTVHEKVIKALIAANTGHEISYGDDDYTRRAQMLLKEIFGEETQSYFVYNGTGANTLGLGTLLSSWQAMISSDIAHINADETGAPEKYSGSKIFGVPTKDGKLTPESILPQLDILGFHHQSQPKVISITNPTEVGTIYTPGEIKAISKLAKKYDLYLHMDGARIANACVALNMGLKEITKDCGVDVLSLGATKCGLMFGEAVVFLSPNLGDNFPYIRKNGTQLHSKMRYISAQYIPWLEDKLYVAGGKHGNMLAKKLSEGLAKIPGAKLMHKVQANGIFIQLPQAVLDKVSAEYYFYTMEVGGGEKAARFMCGYDVLEEEVDKLLALARN